MVDKEILPILEELHDESMKLGIRKVTRKLVSLTNEFNDD